MCVDVHYWYVNYIFFSSFLKGPCISFWKHQKFLHHQSNQPSLDQVAEWLPSYRKWSIEDLNKDNPLKVHFMTRCPDKWIYMDCPITPGVVMQFVNDTWRGAFTIGNEIDSQIRVEFQGIYNTVPSDSGVVYHGLSNMCLINSFCSQGSSSN